ncbi:MAG: UDP-glucose/GDP-mannose dehydrogenase family protein [Spirochaetales bacterium]|nr:UDP-glucose/GDP-mannose dehydrogenase family protein [Spirochaetales bacterium]
MPNIAVIGTGYVGLVTGACLSDFGLNVICVDVVPEKIEMLCRNEIPIYEPGLEDLVQRNVYYKRLTFTLDFKKAVEDCEVIFLAVGTPQADDGSADMTNVRKAVADIAGYMNGYKVIVNKSTVPVGTGRLVRKWVEEGLAKRKTSIEFDVVSNPEFLREGSAVYDFLHPDRVVIGTDSERALNAMKSVYRVLYLNEAPFLEVNIETAEMIKYASNAFLAVKITYINEMANLCEKVGANVQDVARAMGKDGRISPKFLHAGPGFGGSCFPKDTNALAIIGKTHGSPVTLVEQVIKANQHQKELMVSKIEDGLSGVKGKTLAVLGLSFKPNTDDMREAPSLTIINSLVRKGAKIMAYDPIAVDEARKCLSGHEGSIGFCADEYDAVTGADALIIITEWNQFRNLDFDRIKQSMKTPVIFDLRNIYTRSSVEARGFKYFGVGV